MATTITINEAKGVPKGRLTGVLCYFNYDDEPDHETDWESVQRRRRECDPLMDGGKSSGLPMFDPNSMTKEMRAEVIRLQSLEEARSAFKH